MNIYCEVNNGSLWVTVSGELDLHIADSLRDELDFHLDKSGVRNMVLDFAGVTFIDSSGLGVLLGRYRQLSPRGGRIKIRNISPQVYRVLELSGLTKILDVEENALLRAEQG